MNAVDIIHKKRTGHSLNRNEISWIINGICNNSIPDYQLSALLMAICFNGMRPKELSIFTDEMAQSGDFIDFPKYSDLLVDKHSSGGVGDKTTLIVVPLVSVFSLPVIKLSGRGLGHTGGTLDKLESIPGFRTALTKEEIIRQTESYGLCIAGQSGDLAPADKKLYALRDVTDTVASIPLIASSIMSKKLSIGTKGIVLDVKSGNGAFMKEDTQAKLLAQAMIRIGKDNHRKMTAVISDMSSPLGHEVGNANEVAEAIQTLKGQGPEDLIELSLTLAEEMLLLGNVKVSREDLTAALNDGRALRKFEEMVAAQGGNPKITEKLNLLPQPSYLAVLKADNDGYIHFTDTVSVGLASNSLGAGRKTTKDIIDPSAGITVHYQEGSFVSKGDTLFTLFSSSHSDFSESIEILKKSYLVQDIPSKTKTVIHDVLR